MSSVIADPVELRRRGFEALVQALGWVTAVRFLRQYEVGQGDIRDPFRPTEVAFFIPARTASTAGAAIQTNNVEVDDRGFVYLADRAGAGLHIVELTGDARKIAAMPGGPSR